MVFLCYKQFDAGYPVFSLVGGFLILVLVFFTGSWGVLEKLQNMLAFFVSFYS